MSPQDHVLYSMFEKEIVLTDLQTGDVLWSGQPLGYPVVDVIAIPGTTHALVLLDYGADDPRYRPIENLVCIDQRGAVQWRATLPNTGTLVADSFVAVELSQEGVVAHSWSCYRCVIDPATGETRSVVFTK
jgi:outer membrane protein assembly factor BamB